MVGVAHDYLAYLQAIVLREEEKGDHDAGLRTRLMKLFTGPPTDGVYCVETKDGVRYYLPAEQDFAKKTTVRISYLVGFAGETKSRNHCSRLT